MIRRLPLRYTWKIIFAITALADVAHVSLLLRINSGGSNSSKKDGFCHLDSEDWISKYSTNSTFDYYARGWTTATIGGSGVVWVGPLFCFMCLVEALVRAVEARKAALDNRALDNLEKSILNAAHTSSLKISQLFGVTAENDHTLEVAKTSKFLRAWVPTVATIAFWLFILPTDLADFQQPCGTDHLNDSAVATKYFTLMSLSTVQFVLACQGRFETFFWTRIMPYRIHKAPRRFMKRLQEVLRIIRFLRFAGPLARMGLKLQDQIRAMRKTRRQSMNTDMEKQRRMRRPSMLFADIQKLESLAKVQMALAKIPSNLSLFTADLSSSVMESYNKKRTTGKRIARQLAKLQKDYFGEKSAIKTSDLYDRIMKITQDITVSLSSDKRSFTHRYLMSPRALLSSRRNLISPRTRFSLAWRMTVTNCLMLEIFRLCLSWHFSGSFSISLSQIVGKLLVECKTQEKTKNHLAFITDQINNIQRHLYKILPILGPTPVDIAVCIPSGPHALLILHFGRFLEIFVDGIAFLDIFVWFLTGDIDVETHAVIPKPFISRCVIPGTLVQVLDHPTVPNLLPNLLKHILEVSSLVGYSRCIRWVLGIIPALKILMFDPLKRFLFRHIDEDEGWMHYAESVGMLTPERKVGYGGSNASLGTGKSLLSRKNSDAFNTSQVGLSFDASPASSRHDLQSMTSTEISTNDESHFESRLQSQPIIYMNRSPSRNRKSVHFGLDHSPSIDEMNNNGDYSFSYSSSELHAKSSS